jgi:hypothetical protein
MTDIKHCAGCTEDFYNGNNPLGVKECWNRKTAEMVNRVFVHIDQPPPYRNFKARTVPGCYRLARHVSVEPEAILPNGYWR